MQLVMKRINAAGHSVECLSGTEGTEQGVKIPVKPQLLLLHLYHFTFCLSVISFTYRLY